MILHTYPGRTFVNSDFGDFIPYVGVYRFTKTLSEWKEELSRIVNPVELKEGDYNISPAATSTPVMRRLTQPLAEIIEELNMIEAEAKETDKVLRVILEKFGV